MNQQREAPPHSAQPHLPTILDSPVSMSDANGMYGTALSLAATSPYQMPLLSASIETPHPFDEPNPFELNFDFLTSPPGLDSIPARSASSNTGTDMDAAQYIDVETFGQHFPSMPDLNFESLRSVSSHPIFDQDQVASFRRSIEKTTQRGHDCMALALQVVNNLSVTREPCMVATSNPMTGIEAHRTEARDVDTVLFINRDAAQSVKKILECSCISDQAVALACYLATSKIVDWYGAAIEAVGGRPEDTEQYLKIQGLRSSQGIMAERIIARPIYMGKYCLDPEVQRVVRAQVVLGELKEHVQPLLNSLPRFHVTGLEADNDSTAKTQACVLRTQLRTVVQNARNLNGSGPS